MLLSYAKRLARADRVQQGYMALAAFGCPCGQSVLTTRAPITFVVEHGRACLTDERCRWELISYLQDRMTRACNTFESRLGPVAGAAEEVSPVIGGKNP